MHVGQGSVTSITNVGGAVQERYLFDQDGQVQVLTATADVLGGFGLVEDEITAVREIRAFQVTEEFAAKAGFQTRFYDLQDMYTSVLRTYNVPQPAGFQQTIARFWPKRP